MARTRRMSKERETSTEAGWRWGEGGGGVKGVLIFQQTINVPRQPTLSQL